MANQHFGKISEVWKHGVLAEVLDTDRPSGFAETHAGSAFYPMRRSPERDYGVLRFFAMSERHETLGASAYRRVLGEQPMADAIPRRCPGSPLVAMSILGASADYRFFDVDPESVATIAATAHERGLDARVRAEVADGVSGTLAAAAASPIACIHIDPFDPLVPTTPGGRSPVEAARTLAAGGALLYWYGVEDHPLWAWDAIALVTADVAWWVGELRYAEPETDSGITGCGMLVANASTEATERCETFGRALVAAYTDAPLPSGAVGSLSFTSSRS